MRYHKCMPVLCPSEGYTKSTTCLSVIVRRWWWRTLAWSLSPVLHLWLCILRSFRSKHQKPIVKRLHEILQVKGNFSFPQRLRALIFVLGLSNKGFRDAQVCMLIINFMDNTQCWQLTKHFHICYSVLVVAPWDKQFQSLWYTLWPREDEEEKIENKDDNNINSYHLLN